MRWKFPIPEIDSVSWKFPKTGNNILNFKKVTGKIKKSQLVRYTKHFDDTNKNIFLVHFLEIKNLFS